MDGRQTIYYHISSAGLRPEKLKIGQLEVGYLPLKLAKKFLCKY